MSVSVCVCLCLCLCLSLCSSYQSFVVIVCVSLWSLYVWDWFTSICGNSKSLCEHFESLCGHFVSLCDCFTCLWGHFVSLCGHSEAILHYFVDIVHLFQLLWVILWSFAWLSERKCYQSLQTRGSGPRASAWYKSIPKFIGGVMRQEKYNRIFHREV